MQDFISHNKKLQFDSNYNGKSFKDFKQWNDMILKDFKTKTLAFV